MAKLITGGTGHIGSELARLLVSHEKDVVIFDIVINRHRVEDIEEKLRIVRGDVGNFSEVLNVIRDNDISEIYHLGSMLTVDAEGNPWAAFRSNMIGTYNIMEAARLFGVKKVMFASSLATFGLESGEIISDITIQRPATFYGIGKLYCEGLGRWYINKFNMDFRSVRYAAVTAPGVYTPGHWWGQMIEHAVLHKPYECIFGIPDVGMSLIHQLDAARAAEMVMHAPKDRIKMINYNVAGIPETISPLQLEKALLKQFPDFKVTYNSPPDAIRGMKHSGLQYKVFDDSLARKEWDWVPEYDTVEKIIEQFEKNIKEHPKCYGSA